MKNDELEQWAQSKNTSIEIARAMRELSGPYLSMENLWNTPTDAEEKEILKRAFASCEDNELNWGAETIRRGE